MLTFYFPRFCPYGDEWINFKNHEDTFPLYFQKNISFPFIALETNTVLNFAFIVKESTLLFELLYFILNFSRKTK